MEWLEFNQDLYLWRHDIEDSIVLYKIGGERVFQITGKVKGVFLELLENRCNLHEGKLRDFLVGNGIFREVKNEA